MNGDLRAAAFGLFLVGAVAAADAGQPDGARPTPGGSAMEQHAAADAKDRLRVTVMLAGIGEGPAYVGEIARAQDKFIADLAAAGLVVDVSFKFSNVASMVIEADRRTCDRIRARPDVLQVVEDFVLKTQ
jgi:hypothetical protein